MFALKHWKRCEKFSTDAFQGLCPQGGAVCLKNLPQTWGSCVGKWVIVMLWKYFLTGDGMKNELSERCCHCFRVFKHSAQLTAALFYRITDQRHERLPYFVFGDFNFRLDCKQVIEVSAFTWQYKHWMVTLPTIVCTIHIPNLSTSRC